MGKQTDLKFKSVSDNTIRRLPKYLRKLDDLHECGVERTSSAALGDMLGLTFSQIRQDLSSFGSFGTQGYGYNVSLLRQAIHNALGVNRRYSAVLVGTGNIGRALLENFDFSACGFEIKAAFDVKYGTAVSRLGGIPFFPASEMESYISARSIDAAVLCVPRDAARQTAQTLADCGIKAIWNFTNEDLYLPPAVNVENVHFSDSLLTLSYRLAERDMKSASSY